MSKVWSLALLLLISFSAQASLPARATKDDTDVFFAPNLNSKVVLKIPKGTAFESSNYPVEGFFKVRLADGAIGWIAADHVALYDPDELPEEKVIDKPSWGRFQRNKWSIRLTGGMDMYMYPTLASAFPGDTIPLPTGLHGTLELDRILESGSGFFMRADYVKWVSTGTVTGSGYSTQSVPLTVGLLFCLGEGNFLSSRLGVGAGLDFFEKTSVTSSFGTSYMAPPYAVAALVKIDFNLALGAKAGIFLEGGARATAALSAYSFTTSDGSAPATTSGLLMAVLTPYASGGFSFSF